MQRVMVASGMWSWVPLTIAFVLCLTLNDVSEASQAALVGTVYCDTCFHQDFSKSSHFISGALVAVECGDDGIHASGTESRFWEEVKTDESGEFRVTLPFSVSKHVNKIKGCSVKLISSSEPDCAVAATTTSSSIRLKAKTPGNHVFSAGFFTFKPLKQPKLCQTKPRNENSNDEFSAATPFPSLVVDGMLAPPPRPAGFPIPPVTPGKQTTMEPDDLTDANAFGLPFPPNPFEPPSLDSPFPFKPPPASIFNPIPLQPPPDSIFNPLPFQQSPPSLIPELLLPPPPPPPLFPSLPFPPLEPQPDLSQSPPPPPLMPPPAFLPPFPFQPTPGFPGMPPATSSAHLKKTSSR